MSDPNALVYDFVADLTRFGDEIADGATKVLQEAAQTTAEAITIGNQFGPGIPVDTGFARASFRVGVGSPADGPSEAPPRPKGLPAGVRAFDTPIDMGPIGRAALGDALYITTQVEYAQVLEFEAKRRRFGANAGASTEFLEPVEARFTQIVDDAADRVGYGQAGAR